MADGWKHSPIVNNHFDTDGVLSIATLLCPSLAREHRELFLAAAEAGDFQEWPELDDGIRLDAAILALGAREKNDGAAYAAVLPQLPELLRTLAAREDLWGTAWQKLRDGLKAVNDGRVSATRRGWLGVVRHSREFHSGAAVPRELPGPVLHRLHPTATGRWLLFDAENDLFHARYEHPRHAWADTVVRMTPEPLDAAVLASRLGPMWRACAAMPGTTGVVETVKPISALPEI